MNRNAIITTRKVEKKSFWDFVWNSEKLTEGTDMLDIYIPHASIEFSYTLFGEITGKKLLDIGCGSGLQTLALCKKGAFVTAIDTAEQSVRTTKDICRQNNITNITVKKMSAESMDFKDNFFDIVYISRMLVHTKKEHVLHESLRVLKKGGLLVVCEPLKYWIFAFPYRTFSPYRKSHPTYISLQDIKKLNAQHKEFYLLSTFFFFLFYMPLNKKTALKIFNFFARIDAILLETIPFLRNIAWLTVVYLRKKY